MGTAQRERSSTDTLNKYLNLSVKSLLLDNLHNTPEIAQYREEYKTWKEELDKIPHTEEDLKDPENKKKYYSHLVDKPEPNEELKNRFDVSLYSQLSCSFTRYNKTCLL